MSQYNHIIGEGYLYKKGVYNTAWQRRYFILYGNRIIAYFKDKSAATQGKNAKGTIRLTQIERVELVQCGNSSTIRSLTNQKKPNKKTNIEHTSFNGVISSLQSPPDYPTINPLTLQDSKSVSATEAKEAFVEIYSRPPLARSKSEKTMLSNANRMIRIRKWSSNTNYSTGSGSGSEYNSLDNSLECGDFSDILNNSISGLKCDRMYAFALVSNSRQWILSAENTKDLKLWISNCNKLTQGQEIYDGYLNKDKYYVLYANKVLHCYKNESKVDIENDFDLRIASYMNYDLNQNRIKIGLSNDENIILCANNERETKIWLDVIESLFDKSVLKYKYCSLIQTINISHDSIILTLQHVGFYSNYMIIFNNKSHCDSIKNTLFFKKVTFRDYIHFKKCILIPLTQNIIIRRASKINGKYAFCVSNPMINKKYYFSVKTKEILNKWIDVLSVKYSNNIKMKTHKGSSFSCSDIDIDIQIETKKKKLMVRQKDANESENKKKQFPFRGKTNLRNIALSPILDNFASKSANAFPDTLSPMKEYRSDDVSPTGHINDELNNWEAYLKSNQ